MRGLEIRLKSLNYQVAPAKTGLTSRGEYHSLSWQFLHMRDRKRVRSRQRSLLLRFPTQIETSVSREKTILLHSKICGICSLTDIFELCWFLYTPCIYNSYIRLVDIRLDNRHSHLNIHHILLHNCHILLLVGHNVLVIRYFSHTLQHSRSSWSVE